jgi:ABC-2 type transport system permease protein
MSDAQILDRGYRKFAGERSGVSGAVKSLAWYTIRSILGLGRPARHKIFPILVAVIAFLPAIIFIGVSILFGDFADELRPQYWELFSQSVMPAILFTALVAPEAIVRDRRDGMLALYLSTPLTKVTYLIAKVTSVASCLFFITCGPPLLLLIGYTFQGQGPDGVDGWSGTAIKLLFAGLVMTAVYTAVSLAASSLTDRRAFASVGVILVLIGGFIIGGILADGAEMSRNFWLASPVNVALESAPRLFGDRSQEMRDVSSWLVTIVTIGWISVGAGLLSWRYKKMAVV